MITPILQLTILRHRTGKNQLFTMPGSDIHIPKNTIFNRM